MSAPVCIDNFQRKFYTTPLVTELPRVRVPDPLADSTEELTYVIPQDLRFVSRLCNHMDVLQRELLFPSHCRATFTHPFTLSNRL